MQFQIQEIRLPNRLATRFPYLPTQFCIIALMSENYQSKRERWQRLLESLPAGLREHVSIRNVEAVAALPQPAQARLSEAIQSGLKRLPCALSNCAITRILPSQIYSNHRAIPEPSSP